MINKKEPTASLCSLERVVRRRLVSDNLDAAGTLLGKATQNHQRPHKADKLRLARERRQQG